MRDVQRRKPNEDDHKPSQPRCPAFQQRQGCQIKRRNSSVEKRAFLKSCNSKEDLVKNRSLIKRLVLTVSTSLWRSNGYLPNVQIWIVGRYPGSGVSVIQISNVQSYKYTKTRLRENKKKFKRCGKSACWKIIKMHTFKARVCCLKDKSIIKSMSKLQSISKTCPVAKRSSFWMPSNIQLFFLFT